MAALDHWAPLLRLWAEPWIWLGAVPATAGLGLMAWAAATLLRHRTPLHPFQQACTLVTDGPFAFSRNPIYLGMALTLLGFALWLGSLSPFAVLPVFVAAIDAAIIRGEEAMLARGFGAAFQAYGDRVRRWL